MKTEEIRTLRRFFDAVRELGQLGIIRSRDYIADVCAHVARGLYGFEQSGRASGPHRDGTVDSKRVRLAFSNCPRGHEVVLEEPLEFDELVVVLGPGCALRPDDLPPGFVVYRFPRRQVLERFARAPSGKLIGGRETFAEGHDTVVAL